MLERCGYQVVSTLECVEGKTEALEPLELWWFRIQSDTQNCYEKCIPSCCCRALKNAILLQAWTPIVWGDFWFASYTKAAVKRVQALLGLPVMFPPLCRARPGGRFLLGRHARGPIASSQSSRGGGDFDIRVEFNHLTMPCLTWEHDVFLWSRNGIPILRPLGFFGNWPNSSDPAGLGLSTCRCIWWIQPNEWMCDSWTSQQLSVCEAKKSNLETKRRIL